MGSQKSTALYFVLMAAMIVAALVNASIFPSMWPKM